MSEVEAENEKAKSPEYKAPGSRSHTREPREKNPVLNTYFTPNFRSDPSRYMDPQLSPRLPKKEEI